MSIYVNSNQNTEMTQQHTKRDNIRLRLSENRMMIVRHKSFMSIKL